MGSGTILKASSGIASENDRLVGVCDIIERMSCWQVGPLIVPCAINPRECSAIAIKVERHGACPVNRVEIGGTGRSRWRVLRILGDNATERNPQEMVVALVVLVTTPDQAVANWLKPLVEVIMARISTSFASTPERTAQDAAAFFIRSSEGGQPKRVIGAPYRGQDRGKRRCKCALCLDIQSGSKPMVTIGTSVQHGVSFGSLAQDDPFQQPDCGSQQQQVSPGDLPSHGS